MLRIFSLRQTTLEPIKKCMPSWLYLLCAVADTRFGVPCEPLSDCVTQAARFVRIDDNQGSIAIATLYPVSAGRENS